VAGKEFLRLRKKGGQILLDCKGLRTKVNSASARKKGEKKEKSTN